MEQEYIIYIILAFLLGFLLKSLLNTNFCSKENFFAEPLSWVRIGGENDTVNVPDNTSVRYGDPVSNIWVEKVMSGSFQANNTIFGDPTPGVVKEIQSLTTATSEIDEEDSTSTVDTDPPSTDTTPIDFNKYNKIVGKSKNGKTIKRYNYNQHKCVRECASNKQCIGIVTNKSGSKCKTITDFSNPYKRSTAIAYLKK